MTILDDKKNELAVGDCIRSVESSWHGQIQDTYDAGNDEDGHMVMLICKGINYWTGEIDEDDVQHFAANDVVKWTRKAQKNDPVNGFNFL